MVMSVDPAAAERIWFAVAPDGSEHTLVLRVGVPTQQPEGQWGASISLGVLDPRAHPSLALMHGRPWTKECASLLVALSTLRKMGGGSSGSKVVRQRRLRNLFVVFERSN